jgi:hypothetical protein
MSDPKHELEEIANRERSGRARRRKWRAWINAPRLWWEGRQSRARERLVSEGHPISSWQQGRIGLALMVGGVATAVSWNVWGARQSVWPLALCALAVAAFVAQGWWWPRHLPFRLTDADRVRGERPSAGKGQIPYVHFTITVHRKDKSQGESELAAVLELFAERLNDAQQANKHFATSVERPWRVVAGESLTGELDGSMWGSRLLERWVVRDLRLLHRICPIREVVVEARYTGATYRIATTVSV